MLTDEQTEQLAQDIQAAYPGLAVTREIYQTSREYVVIVRDPSNQNEVRITSLRSDWRTKVGRMSAASTPDTAG